MQFELPINARPYLHCLRSHTTYSPVSATAKFTPVRRPVSKKYFVNAYALLSLIVLGQIILFLFPGVYETVRYLLLSFMDAGKQYD
jgi:hypothetical protein